MSGKIADSTLPTVITTTKRGLSSFLQNNEISRQIRLLESLESDSYSSENKTLSLIISLISEIILNDLSTGPYYAFPEPSHSFCKIRFCLVYYQHWSSKRINYSFILLGDSRLHKLVVSFL